MKKNHASFSYFISFSLYDIYTCLQMEKTMLTKFRIFPMMLLVGSSKIVEPQKVTPEFRNVSH